MRSSQHVKRESSEQTRHTLMPQQSRTRRARGPAFAALVVGAVAAAFAQSAHGQFSLTTTTYNQNFNNLGTGFSTVAGGNLGLVNASLTGWSFLETGTAANTTITAGTGSSATGDTYNTGVVGNADRALGALQSGSVASVFGFYFTNNIGTAITSMTISYKGETWRVGTAGRSDRLDFQVSTTATSLGGTFTDADAFDYVGPIQALANGSELSNANITGVLTQSISNGSSFFIRWSDFNATGSDDLLAIDDFNITFTVAGVTKYWDLNGIGSGTGSFGAPGNWDNTTSNWSTSSAGNIAPTTFNSADLAVFGGTGNTVNIQAAGVTAGGGIQFDSNGYTVASVGGGVLTLGQTSTVTVTNAADTATINAKISGNSGLTKAGAGQLILGNAANDFSSGIGPLAINGGTLTISSDGNLGNTGNDITFGGGALRVTANVTLDVGREVIGNGGIIDVPAANTLIINGGVNLGGGVLTLSNSGAVVLASPIASSIGGISFLAPGTLDAGVRTILVGGDITTSHTSGTALIGGTLNFGSNPRNITVADGSAAEDLDFVGNIIGSGRVSKLGAGAFAMVGDNSSFSGGFNIGGTGVAPAAGGRLIIADKNALGTGQLRFNNGTLSAGSTLTGANAIVASSFTVGAPDTVNGGVGAAFAGANMEFTGGFSIFKTAAVPQTKMSVYNTTTLTGAFGASNVLAGSFGLTIGGTGSLIIANASNGHDLPTTVDQATVIVAGAMTSASNTWTIQNGGTLQIGSGGTAGSITTGDVTNNANLAFKRSDTLTFANNINGSGNFYQTGTGKTILTGTNGYGGTTTIESGTLQVGNGSTTGTLGSGDLTNNASLAFNRSNALTVSNNISGTGHVVQNGSGVTTLSGTNTYTGGTTINNGTVKAGSDSAIGDNTNTTTVASGATLDINARSITQGQTNLSGTGVGGNGALINSNATLGAYSSPMNLVATASIGGSGDFNIFSKISGSGGLTKVGSNSIGLFDSPNSDYTGKTTITAGQLDINTFADAGTPSSLGAPVGANAIIDLGTANMRFVNSGVDQSTNRTVNLIGNGSVVGDAFALLILTGGITGNGNLTLGGFTGGQVNSVISHTGNLTKENNSVWTLGGANTYTGSTIVNNGILKIAGGDDRLPTSTTLDVEGFAQFELNAQNQTVGGLTGTSGNALIRNTTAGNSRLTVNVPNATTNTFMGVVGIAVDAGVLGLTKSGQGKLILSGNTNQYTGTTVVNGGTLIVNSGHVGGDSYTVGANGSLGGSAVITLAGGANVTINGNVSPGNSAGELTLTTAGAGFTVLAPGGKYTWESTQGSVGTGTPGSDWDKLTLTGMSVTATTGSKFTIVLTPLTGFLATHDPNAYQVWTIGSYTSIDPLNTFDTSKFIVDTSALAPSENLGGFYVRVSNPSGAGDLELVYVPEPGTACIMLLPITLAMKRRRRR